WALALLLVGLGLVRRRRYSTRAARLGLKPSPLLPFVPPLARDGVLVIAALGYARALPEEPMASLVFLSVAVLVQLERVPSSLRPARPGAFEPVAPDERAAARRGRMWSHLGLDALLDATKPLGLLTLGLLFAALCWLARGDAPSHQLAASVPFAALWLVPTFLSGHARTLPPDMYARLAWADATVERLQGPGRDLRALRHRAANGRVQDVRVGVELDAPQPGLLRLQLLLAASPGISLAHVQVAALIVTRPQSPADQACARAFPHTSAWTSGDRRARLLPVTDELEAQLEALSDALSRARDVDDAGRPSALAPACTRAA
ncbi:MAG: hypothetical protein GXP55_25115, partial [Deltaproteobacteria bacterium]|nr:hypothetical protein [Deltaproteobacteria bacterium]